MKERITTEEAMNLAEDKIRGMFGEFIPPSLANVTSARYLEAEGCWIFLKNEAIEIPSEHFYYDCALAVSKLGRLAIIPGFGGNDGMLTDYLEIWSLHALGRAEESKLAVKAFNAKHSWKFIV